MTDVSDTKALCESLRACSAFDRIDMAGVMLAEVADAIEGLLGELDSAGACIAELQLRLAALEFLDNCQEPAMSYDPPEDKT